MVATTPAVATRVILASSVSPRLDRAADPILPRVWTASRWCAAAHRLAVPAEAVTQGKAAYPESVVGARSSDRPRPNR